MSERWISALLFIVHDTSSANIKAKPRTENRQAPVPRHAAWDRGCRWQRRKDSIFTTRGAFAAEHNLLVIAIEARRGADKS